MTLALHHTSPTVFGSAGLLSQSVEEQEQEQEQERSRFQDVITPRARACRLWALLFRLALGEWRIEPHVHLAVRATAEPHRD
jgi:hypothetical protein